MRNMVTADAISDSYDDWLQKAGVVKHGIEGAFVSQGWRGVVANREIPPGKLTFVVLNSLSA